MRFADGVRRLEELGVNRFLELGPDGVLTAMAQYSLAGDGRASLVAGMRRDRPEARTVTAAMAGLYVHGASVDWSAVFAGTGARLVELPTYAFQRERFWPDARPGAAAAVAADGADARFWDAVEREDLESLAGTLELEQEALGTLLPALSSWRRGQQDRSRVDRQLYRVAWKPLERVTGRSLTGRLLVLVPAGAGGAAGDAWTVSVLDGLAASGAEVEPVECEPGVERSELAERLRGVIAAGAAPLAGVVSLLALAEGESESVPVGLASTAVLVQALGDAGVGARLWTLTRGAVSVGRSDGAPDPVQASVWGLGRVAALELPERWGGLVDLPRVLDRRAVSRLVGVLGGADEDQVAVRGSGVFGRRLSRVPGTDVAVAGWKPSGTVLVTGGTGALGVRVARWLAGSGAEHLVLTSRRGPAAEGAALVRGAVRARGAGHRRGVRCGGSGVRAASACRRMPVDAVVHAAGVLDDGVIEHAHPRALRDGAARKIAGAVLLDRLTRDRELSAFVVFSSFAGAVGSPGQGNYAAANAFLDALVEQRRAAGLPGTSVAWGPWAEGGMAAEDGVGDYLRRRGLAAMEPDSALRALERVVAGQEPVVVVADVDWSRFTPAFTGARASALLAGLPEAVVALEGAAATAGGGGSGLLEPAAAPGRGGARDRVLLELVRAQAAVRAGPRGSAGGGAQPGLPGLGLHSLTAVELRNRLNTVTGLLLPATLVFDYPNPADLAAFLRSELLGPDSGLPTEGIGPEPARSAADRPTTPVVIVGMACRFPGGVASPEELVAVWCPRVRTRSRSSRLIVAGIWSGSTIRRGVPGRRMRGMVGSSTTRRCSTRGSSGSRRVRRWRWIRSSGCCWRRRGRRSERGGIDPGSLRGGRTGVFVGSNGQDYVALLLDAARGRRGAPGDRGTRIGDLGPDRLHSSGWRARR